MPWIEESDRRIIRSGIVSHGSGARTLSISTFVLNGLFEKESK